MCERETHLFGSGGVGTRTFFLVSFFQGDTIEEGVLLLKLAQRERTETVCLVDQFVGLWFRFETRAVVFFQTERMVDADTDLRPERKW